MKDQILQGDCLKKLRELKENSVDTCITDPPYGLSQEPDIAEVLKHWLAGDDYNHSSKGFMGKSWDSFVPGPAIWSQVYRVLKPGATLLAFGGTRTSDLLSIAIRLGGFKKFDEIDFFTTGLPESWIYGSGFPKSYDLSKGMDQVSGLKREVVAISDNGIAGGTGKHTGIDNCYGYQSQYAITKPKSLDGLKWQGFGTALKPAHEVILCFRKPREGSYVSNALEYGVAGLNIDASRIGTEPFKTLSKNGIEAVEGRWPANLILCHHPYCLRKGLKRVKPHNGSGVTHGHYASDGNLYGIKSKTKGDITSHGDISGVEQVVDWDCHPNCPVLELEAQAGNGEVSFRKNNTSTDKAWFGSQHKPTVGYKDQGSVSRFFYQAKASKTERMDYNKHPTVKPLQLFIYLCKLTKMPSQESTVLDPFAGSGTTALAALATQRPYIMIENDPDYIPIMKRRIADYEGSRYDDEVLEAFQEEKMKERQLGLFTD